MLATWLKSDRSPETVCTGCAFAAFGVLVVGSWASWVLLVVRNLPAMQET